MGSTPLRALLDKGGQTLLRSAGLGKATLANTVTARLVEAGD